MILWTAIFGVVLINTGANAASIGSATGGHVLAEQSCADCHVIAAGVKPRRLVDAPSFPDLVRDPKFTPFRLRSFLQTPHQVMPNFILSTRDVDDLVAYLLRLQKQLSK